MKAIVAVDQNWGIGCNGNLLQRIPEDMKFFKQMTLGKVVVMGRVTFESFPGKKPLVNRTNIVLSHRKDFDREDFLVCHSIDELFKTIQSYPPDDVFVIGGEAIYTALLQYCTEVYVTKIENEYKADKYFPNLGNMENWAIASTSEQFDHEGISYCFVKYKNRDISGG